jgi:LemA protein
MQRILRDDPDGLDRLPPNIRALVEQLMAKDPGQRPESANAVAESLKALASDSGPATQSVAAASEISGSTKPETPSATTSEAWGGGVPPNPSLGVLRLIIGGACALLLLAGSWIFVQARNELVTLDTQVEGHWHQVENQLARQRALLPQLSTLLDRYVSYEQEGIERILTALSPAQSGELEAQNRSTSEIDRLLMGVLLLDQSAPMLRADAQFRALAYEISGTKNRIAVERGRYNEAVGQFNRRLNQYPWKIVSHDYAPELYYEERSASPVTKRDFQNSVLGG